MDSASISTLSDAVTGSAAAGFIPVVGIVGGVGSGKSAVVLAVSGVRLWVIDADRIGHQQLQNAVVAEQLVREFGEQILDGGVISRVRLAALVFQNSPESERRLKRLNEIVRPGIQAEIHRRLQSVPQDVDAVILDAALLLEAGWADHCDALVWIHATLQQRQQRVVKARGWTVGQHTDREAAQWDSDRKRAACEFEVDNSGGLEAAGQQLQGYLRLIVSRGRRTDRRAVPFKSAGS